MVMVVVLAFYEQFLFAFRVMHFRMDMDGSMCRVMLVCV